MLLGPDECNGASRYKQSSAAAAGWAAVAASGEADAGDVAGSKAAAEGTVAGGTAFAAGWTAVPC